MINDAPNGTSVSFSCWKGNERTVYTTAIIEGQNSKYSNFLQKKKLPTVYPLRNPSSVQQIRIKLITIAGLCKSLTPAASSGWSWWPALSALSFPVSKNSEWCAVHAGAVFSHSKAYWRQLTWRPVLCLWVVWSRCSSVHAMKSFLPVTGTEPAESRGLWC